MPKYPLNDVPPANADSRPSPPRRKPAEAAAPRAPPGPPAFQPARRRRDPDAAPAASERVGLRSQCTLALIILFGASLVVFAIACWNRRLVQEIDVRQRTELELRKPEARLQDERDALQQTEMELQQNKEALQDLNVTLEARLKAAIDERTRALSEAAARAQDSGRAKSAFLSAVSHDLRSPSHDILGDAGLLARQLPDPAREQIQIIQDSSKHLLRLIDDILAYSRDEANRVVLMAHPLSLGHLAEHLKAAYQPVAERTNNRFVVQLDCASAQSSSPSSVSIGTGVYRWLVPDRPSLSNTRRQWTARSSF